MAFGETFPAHLDRTRSLDSLPYIVGSTYTRKAIWDALEIPESGRGGDWHTGYHRHEGDYYLFCNVGMAGRTGHDYDNHWEGEKLVWYGKSGSSFEHESIRNLVSGQFRVLVFYRTTDRAPFFFAGVGHAVPHPETSQPVRVDWTFGSDEIVGAPVFTDEYVPGATFQEGQRIQVLVNRYERDRRARDECVRHHGAICSACRVDMEAKYGELGKGFIHVHHVVQLSDVGVNYVVDPIRDLVPVCPNCHAMLHRRNRPLTVEELREHLVRKERGAS